MNLLFFVFSAKVVTDRNTGFSKGFGFVKYATLDDAAKGIEGMDAKVGFLFSAATQYLQLMAWSETRNTDNDSTWTIRNNSDYNAIMIVLDYDAINFPRH